MRFNKKTKPFGKGLIGHKDKVLVIVKDNLAFLNK
jgi:hypothetical protein